MAHDEPRVRPETYALDALIRETVAQAERDTAAATADALLFLGNWHQSFPTLVVQDPVLEPVDKLVWMVICLNGRTAGERTAFPSYTEIARLANVSSTSTVSRAIAILRATRWLSLCARSRDAGGRFRGNVYALHDEPLPLPDALHLDPEYMEFLREATRHHHARVRRVVAAVLESLDEAIRAGHDVLAPENAVARRLEAVQALQHGGDRRYFSFSATVLTSLANGRDDRDQKSKAVPADRQISKADGSSSSSSSSNKEKTTTTRKVGSMVATPEADSIDDLVFPARLAANQRVLAARYLAGIPAALRQPVLDELTGRLQAEAHGAQPVYDALRYLHRLCVSANRGTFQPNLGLKVKASRDVRNREIERARTEAEARKKRQKTKPVRPDGESPFAEIRRRLEGRSPADGKPR